MRTTTTTVFCSALLAALASSPAQAQSPMVFAATQTAVSCQAVVGGHTQRCQPIVRYFLGRNGQQFLAFELEKASPGRTALLLAGPASQTSDPLHAAAPINVVTLNGTVMPATGSCSIQRRPLRPNRQGGWYMTMDFVACSIRAKGTQVRVQARGDGTDSKFEDL